MNRPFLDVIQNPEIYTVVFLIECMCTVFIWNRIQPPARANTITITIITNITNITNIIIILNLIDCMYRLYLE